MIVKIIFGERYKSSRSNSLPVSQRKAVVLLVAEDGVLTYPRYVLNYAIDSPECSDQ
jgi:hypothetical protein